MEAATGADYEQIHAELSGPRQSAGAHGAYRGAANRPARNTTSSCRAAGLHHGTGALAMAVGELFTQAPAFAPYARATCARCSASPKPRPGRPTPMARRGAGGRRPRRPPRGAADAHDASGRCCPTVSRRAERVHRGDRGGRGITDGVLKNAVDRMWSAYREFENALKAGEDGYQPDMTGDAPFTVDVATSAGRFRRGLRPEDLGGSGKPGVLLEDRERTVLEDSLLTALAKQIHSRVISAKDLVAEMDADMRSKPMSSGMTIGIRWVRADNLTEQQAAVSHAGPRRRGLGPDELAELRGLLRAMIHDHRAKNPRDTYREVLAAVLDYRSWHAFELRMLSPGSPPQRLTRKRHSEMSGGENPPRSTSRCSPRRTRCIRPRSRRARAWSRWTRRSRESTTGSSPSCSA